MYLLPRIRGHLSTGPVLAPMAAAAINSAARAATFPSRALTVAAQWRAYAEQWRAYSLMPGAELLRIRDAMPQIADRLAVTPIDHHYFYQDIWAAKRIRELMPPRHVDVGSRVDLVGFLTVLTAVTFVDIRPLTAALDRLDMVEASITDLPFPDRSVESLSCLNVAEHVGLGRYGDELAPDGTRRAIGELQRILATSGQLLFSVPIGSPRVCFNAHRIHDPLDVVEMFNELRLSEFSAVDDAGQFVEGCDPAEFRQASFSCGLFRFVRAPSEGRHQTVGTRSF